MELQLVRTTFTDKSTLGKLAINGVFQCYTLEDRCRESEPGMWKRELKVPGETAIPYGRYRVIMSMSDRFKRIMPEVLSVPDFTGIRIHSGNQAKDTSGCILPGLTRATDWVGNSAAAYFGLFLKIDHAYTRGEKIYLEITK